MYKLLAAALVAFAAPRAHADPRVDPLQDMYRDRDRALDAVADVDTDARVLRVQVYRVSALRDAWTRAIEADHPNDAGRWAVAHLAALRDEKAARKQLALDRDTLHVARLRLTADEFELQHPKNGRG